MQKIYKNLRQWLLCCCCLVASIAVYADIEIVSVAPESAAGAADGRVVVRAIGSAGPFDFRIVGVSGDAVGYTRTLENNNIAFFDNLRGGNYEVTVTNAYGCGLLLEVDLQTCGVLPFNETITPSYCDQNNGSITLSIEDNSHLTFLWGNGATTQNRTGLGQGFYDLTVTNTAENCSYVERFEVEGIESQFVVNLLEYQHASAPSAADGRLVVQAAPTGTYAYQWSDGGTGANRSNLSQQNYTVTVIDALGCSVIKNFTIASCIVNGEPEIEELPNGGTIIIPTFESAYPDFDIQIVGGFVHPDFTEVTCRALIKIDEGIFTENIPDNYNIVWRLNGVIISNEQTVTFPKNAYVASPYSGISLKISDGCQEKEAFRQFLKCGEDNQANLADFFILNENKPCPGFSDGSITLGFENPGLEGDISIVFEGTIDVPFEENNGVITSTIGSLGASSSYDFTITIGDCSFYFIFELENEDRTLLYAGFEEGTGDEFGSCNYVAYCGEESLGELQTRVDVNWDNSAGGIGGCKTPLFCDGEEVGEKRFNKKWGTALEYFLTLIAASNSANSGYPSPYIDDLLDEFEDRVGSDNLCQRVKFCEGNLQFLQTAPFVPFLSREQNGFLIPSMPGCVRVDCDAFFGYEVCPEDIDIPNLEAGIFNCLPRRLNVYGMYLNFGNLAADYGTAFTGSTLATFLFDNGNKPEAKCAFVTFCQSEDGFSYITDNLEEAASYCGTALPAPIIVQEVQSLVNMCDSYYDPDTNQDIVVCPTFPACSSCVSINTFTYPDCDGCLTSGGEVTSLRIVNNSEEAEELLNFGISKDVDAVNPKGLVQLEEGMLFDNYSPDAKSVLKNSISNAKFFIEDWENEHVVYVETTTEHQSYKVILDGSINTWIKNLESNTTLDIQHLSSTRNEILVGGTFSGVLSYHHTPIANASSSNAFLIRLDNQGNLTNQTVVKQLDINEEVLFSENRNGTVIIGGRYTNNNLMVNSSQWTMANGNGWFFMKVNAANQANLISDLAVGNDFDLKDLNFSFDESRFSFAAYGSGSIGINNSVLVSENTPHLVLVNQYVDGNVNWFHLIDGEHINADKFDMAFGEVNNTFVGITFSDELTLLEENLSSHGQEDIALLHLTAGGVKIWTKQYGNQDNETVSQLLYDNMVIYFGGEFDGPSATRTIGKYKFLNPYGSTASKSYISYLVDEYCSDSLYLTNPVTSDNIYQAKEVITTSSKIASSAKVTLQAGDQIHFQAGFHAQVESYVHAAIEEAEDCDDSNSYQPAVEDRAAGDTPLPIPTMAALRCYPNPFQQSTTIEYQLPQSTTVDIALYGMRGEKMAQLLSNQVLEAGQHRINYQASSLPSGIYYLVLRAGKEVLTEKLVVIGR